MYSGDHPFDPSVCMMMLAAANGGNNYCDMTPRRATAICYRGADEKRLIVDAGCLCSRCWDGVRVGDIVANLGGVCSRRGDIGGVASIPSDDFVAAPASVEIALEELGFNVLWYAVIYSRP